jgi:hypothetical protein
MGPIPEQVPHIVELHRCALLKAQFNYMKQFFDDSAKVVDSARVLLGEIETLLDWFREIAEAEETDYTPQEIATVALWKLGKVLEHD